MTIKGQSEELVSRCVECDLAEPESLASLGGSASGVVDGILSTTNLLTTSRMEQMLKKIQIHSSSLETLFHTKAHLSQLTIIIRGANTMLWLNGSLGRSLMIL